jgi:hypothetical protein
MAGLVLCIAHVLDFPSPVACLSPPPHPNQCIEDCETRFDDEQIEQLLTLVQEHLRNQPDSGEQAS